MVSRPAATPVTAPKGLTEAFPVRLLHVPPVTELVSVVVAPTQTVGDPVTVPADGSGLTVAMAVRMQPAGDV